MSHIEVETHPLSPFLPEQTKLLMLGSFPPPQNKWKMQFYYPNYQNDMWRIMGLIFFQDKNYFLRQEEKTFDLCKIKAFLTKAGIGIGDTAYQVQRLQGNASDKFLNIIQPMNIGKVLEKIPQCSHIMTTGDKATETLLLNFGGQPNLEKPQIGQSTQVLVKDRVINLHRMPSSSRAYPLKLEKKAALYQAFFEDIGLYINR